MYFVKYGEEYLHDPREELYILGKSKWRLVH